MDDPRGVGPERVALRPLRPPDERGQPLELAVGSHAEDELSVRRLEHAVGNDLRVGVAVALGLLPRQQSRLRHVDQRRQRRGEEVRLDVSSLPGSLPRRERGEDADRRVAAGEEVRNGDADLRRAGVGGPGDRHEPRAGLREQIEPRSERVRSARAVSGDRSRDELRVLPPHRFGGEAELLEASRRKVFDDDVGAAGEDPHGLGSRLRGEVESDRLLVAVDREEVRRHPRGGIVGRAPAAGDVAVLRVLDLDHAGPEVREHHRAEGARQDPREVEDEHARKRRAHQGLSAPRRARGASRARPGRSGRGRAARA